MLKKLMKWYRGENDIEKTPPRGGLKRVGYILINYTGHLLFINLLFLLCCIPVITIPAALIALNSYLLKIFHQGYNFSVRDFLKEYKNSIIKGIPMGIVSGGILFYGYYLMSLSGNFSEGGVKAAVMGIGIAVFAVAMVLGEYLFLLSAMLSLPLRHLFKNAFILMIIEWKNGLKAMLLSLLVLGILVAFLPYSLYLVLIGFFSVLQLLIISALEPAVMKRIVEPYENEQNEGSDVNNQRDCQIK